MCERLDLGGGQRLCHCVVDVGVGQAPGDAERDRVLQVSARHILQAGPANRVRPRADDHAAGRALPQHPLRLQIGVRARHHLRIGQEFLGEGPILRQSGPRLQSTRSDVYPDLAGKLLVDRHRRIMLYIEHGPVDSTVKRRPVQCPAKALEDFGSMAAHLPAFLLALRGTGLMIDAG